MSFILDRLHLGTYGASKWRCSVEPLNRHSLESEASSHQLGERSRSRGSRTASLQLLLQMPRAWLDRESLDRGQQASARSLAST